VRRSSFPDLRNFLLVCALVAFLPACGESVPPKGSGVSGTDSGRIVVFGIDGADWQVIEPLAAGGRLPHFKRLLEQGATGTLRSMEPSASPSLWTTIATGVRPERHGIHGFVAEGGGGPGDAVHSEEGTAVPTGRRAEVRPVTSSMRRAPAFWNILPRYDRKVGVVGWLVTWPAEETNGFIVSSYLPYIYNWSTGRPLKGTIVSGIPRQTFPETLITTLDSDKVKPGDVPEETVRRFYDPDRVRSLSQDDRDCVEGFLWSLACDETYRRIGLRLFQEYPVDLFAIYFGGVDVASHRFWKFAHPDALDYHVGREEASVLGRVIDEYYVYVDGLLGEYLERIGPDTTLVVLSDHGFKPVLFPGRPTTSGHHRMEGVIALFGRGVRPGRKIEGAGLLDVLPTLLYLLDLPIARDLEGKVLEDALDPNFVRGHRSNFVDSYGTPGRIPEADQTELDRNVLERLRSLGYIN
jgi:predicted AlkP superfamily phosphohydrolase/phosphomutase